MPDIYRYTTNSPRGSCDICDPLDGEEGEIGDVTDAPNPECRHGAGGCSCSLELVSSTEGCYCFDGCSDEYYDDLCECDTGGGPDDGCCCYCDDFDYWDEACVCLDSACGGEDGCNDDTCFPPNVCCDNGIHIECISQDDCDNIGA